MSKSRHSAMTCHSAMLQHSAAVFASIQDNLNLYIVDSLNLNIYKEYKEGTLTLEKFLDYKEIFRKIENEDDPRLNFMAWLAN